MKYGILVFPESNCDHDAFNTASQLSGADAKYIWHKEGSLPSDIDAVIVPGGFSYGDYLRCGAIATYSNIIKDVVRFANEGKPVIGICNGFQILCESGLLPGALLRNSSLNFVCKDTYLKVNNNKLPFTSEYSEGEVLTIPVAHGEGNYYADEETLKSLQNNNQIVFTYVNKSGQETEDSNPNGSMLNIAGISNKNGNVLGMMASPGKIL